MPLQPTFGPLVDDYDVEEAVMTIFRERLPTHIDAVAHYRGVDPAAHADEGFVIRPRTLCRRKEFSGFPKLSLPLVQITSPGMAREPIEGPGGVLTAFWQVDVYSVVAARDYESTRLLRAIWSGGIARCIGQSRTLGGLATTIDILGQSAADVDLPDDSERTLQATVLVMVVEAPGYMDPLAGPTVFIPDDGSGVPGEYDPAVSAESVTIELEPMP
jgi:hypothetical protein